MRGRAGARVHPRREPVGPDEEARRHRDPRVAAGAECGRRRGEDGARVGAGLVNGVGPRPVRAQPDARAAATAACGTGAPAGAAAERAGRVGHARPGLPAVVGEVDAGRGAEHDPARGGMDGHRVDLAVAGRALEGARRPRLAPVGRDIDEAQAGGLLGRVFGGAGADLVVLVQPRGREHHRLRVRARADGGDRFAARGRDEAPRLARVVGDVRAPDAALVHASVRGGLGRKGHAVAELLASERPALAAVVGAVEAVDVAGEPDAALLVGVERDALDLAAAAGAEHLPALDGGRLSRYRER